MASPSISPVPARLLVLGGIGAGKSTVLRRLGELGAVIIEADGIGHRLLEPQGAAYGAVSARWPDAVRGGVIDRAALGAVVFADPGELRHLEAITHPLIRAEIERCARVHASDVVATELPILAPLVGAEWVRVLVDAPKSLRLERAMRRGVRRLDVEARMNVQPTRSQWLGETDHVLTNEGSVEALYQQVDRFWTRLVKPAGSEVTPASNR